MNSENKNFLLHQLRAIVDDTHFIYSADPENEINSSFSLNLPKQQLNDFSYININNTHFRARKIASETEDSNVEYKFKVNKDLNEFRTHSLCTQMKYRVDMYDNNYGIYVIGVHDNGQVAGIKQEDLVTSVRQLVKFAEMINLQPNLDCVVCIDEKSFIAQVSIYKNALNFLKEEHRIMLLGASNSGKSTLLSVLVNSELDNGSGSARCGRFKHSYEECTGMTLSTVYDIIGTNNKNSIVNYKTCERMEEIVEKSDKVFAIFDLSGVYSHIRKNYTLVCSYLPQLCFLLIDSSNLLSASISDLPAFRANFKTEISYLNFLYSMNYHTRIVILLNKIDKVQKIYNPQDIHNRLLQLTQQTQYKKCSLIHLNAQKKFKRKNVYYMFTSCYDGTGLDKLKNFIFNMPLNNNLYYKSNFFIKYDHVFMINNIIRSSSFDSNSFLVVVVGIVLKGVFEINQNNNLFIYVKKDGVKFVPCKIVTIEHHKKNCNRAECNNLVGMAVLIDQSYINSIDTRSYIVKNDQVYLNFDVQEEEKNLYKFNYFGEIDGGILNKNVALHCYNEKRYFIVKEIGKNLIVLAYSNPTKNDLFLCFKSFILSYTNEFDEYNVVKLFRI